MTECSWVPGIMQLVQHFTLSDVMSYSALYDGCYYAAPYMDKDTEAQGLSLHMKLPLRRWGRRGSTKHCDHSDDLMTGAWALELQSLTLHSGMRLHSCHYDYIPLNDF